MHLCVVYASHLLLFFSLLFALRWVCVSALALLPESFLFRTISMLIRFALARFQSNNKKMTEEECTFGAYAFTLSLGFDLRKSHRHQIRCDANCANDTNANHLMKNVSLDSLDRWKNCHHFLFNSLWFAQSIANVNVSHVSRFFCLHYVINSRNLISLSNYTFQHKPL